MSAKHSKGPWELKDDHPKRACIRIFSGHHEIATLYGVDGEKDENEVWRNDPIRMANAHLIAAAPALLEALQGALKALDAISDEMTVVELYTNAGQYLLDALQPARAAIAAAQGTEQGSTQS